MRRQTRLVPKSLLAIGIAVGIAFTFGNAPVALAQTTTNCDAFGGTLTCNTEPSPMAGFAALRDALARRTQQKKAAEMAISAFKAGRCDEARALVMQFGTREDLQFLEQCVTPEQQAAQQQQRLMAGITASVQAGRCDEAKQAALSAGRLDVADQVVRVCTPKKDDVASSGQ